MASGQDVIGICGGIVKWLDGASGLSENAESSNAGKLGRNMLVECSSFLRTHRLHTMLRSQRLCNLGSVTFMA